jgi:hypothetical protein
VIIQNFIRSKLEITSSPKIERAHRLGKFDRSSRRAIIVAFRDHSDTVSIISNAHKLKYTNYNINRDFPQEITNARKSIWNKFKDLKSKFPERKINLVYPAKVIMDGKVVINAFPDWDYYMRGNRITPPLTETNQSAGKSDSCWTDDKNKQKYYEKHEQLSQINVSPNRTVNRGGRQQSKSPPPFRDKRSQAPRRNSQQGASGAEIKRPWASDNNDSNDSNHPR